MRAFSTYMKIIRKAVLGTLIMFTSIFMLFGVIFSFIVPAPADSFQLDTTPVAIVDRDGSALSQAFTSYLEANTQRVTVKDDEAAFRDALFFVEARMIVVIPSGFGASFLAGNPMEIETNAIPDVGGAVFAKNLINSYLTAADLQLRATGELDYAALAENMSLSTAVRPLDSTLRASSMDAYTGANRFMAYLVYPLIGILIYSVGTAFSAFNQRDIKRRNLCSPMKVGTSNLLLLACIGLLSVCVYLLFMGVSVAFCMSAMLTMNGALYALNAFMLLLVGLSISFVVATLVQGNKAISAISNVLSLGLAFLSGSFVPQSLMADSVKQVAMLSPTFWYVRATDRISSLSVFDSETLRPILTDAAMQGLFALAFVAVGFVIVKVKSRE